MAEFKFACPQCQQHILCDTGYMGMRINCPVCQESIVVPPAPSSATSGNMIQMKKSTLKVSALILAGILVATGLAGTAVYFFGGPRTVTFKAYVDGTDVVKLRGWKLWIEHQQWQRPKKISINGKPWTPAWSASKSPTFPSWSDNLTAPYAFAGAFRFGNPEKIKVSKRLGRGTVSILERPSAGNNWTLAILVDDGPFPGADWYEFTASW
ncbi:MAG TPA: hypothetical protein VMB22_05370 [Verrucomicrobiae bacterium]|nr:hypothetical protein [Verrucomicrobiae bacterium]